jgi:hypothetical protein
LLGITVVFSSPVESSLSSKNDIVLECIREMQVLESNR